jgi:hypothetical protein
VHSAICVRFGSCKKKKLTFSLPFAGFTDEPLRTCCGGGGQYNYNTEAPCGSSAATVCEDPSVYLHWDGIHLTEAAYKYIVDGWLDGVYSYPSILNLTQHQIGEQPT